MKIRNILSSILRFFVVWFVDTLAILITIWIVPRFSYVETLNTNILIAAASVAFILGIVNILIRPIVLLLAVPLGMMFVFLLGLFLNTIALMITASLLPNFQIDSWGWAFLGSLMFSAINLIITNILTIDDENSFYQGLIERLAKRRMYQINDDSGRGLVMLEIDGLSYHHMKKAIADGWMPNVKQMIDEENYSLSRVDCGLPSQTSACQSGIMFGDNYDIPAFRWFDKDRNKLMVSSGDATEINARYALGNGLMRSGTSINNMMNGDAQNSLLTLADLRGGSPVEKKQRASDIYLLMLDPYFFTRTIILFCWDIMVELLQAFRQRMRNETPRLNRLHKAYPVLRAATNVFMRDVSANLAKLEIIRGSPAIYLTWPGYDEVAHHSGPWTRDAFGTLKQYDHVVGNIRKIIQEKAPRPYELVILSDHGQSYGATFLQRYGYELKEFIKKQLPEGARAVQVAGGDDGTPSMGAMAAELENVQEQGVGGRLGNSMTKRAAGLLNKGANIRYSEMNALEPASVTVCGSGNLAQVYFDLFPRKITLNEFNGAYPGMVDAVVAHEGVGFVVTYDDEHTPLVLGKGGQRNLHSGVVTGEDPLAPYGDSNFRAEQVRRIADFPHAGDLIVMSTFYSDGTVAAMEELIGNHGGLGGEQTDAFIFHSIDMVVPETSNSTDVFTIFNQQRGKMGAPTIAEKLDGEHVDAWQLRNILKGLAQVKIWISLTMGAILLQRDAYRKVAGNELMTGPAILLGIVGTIILSMTQLGGISLGVVLIQIAVWFVTVLVMYLAGRLLRGKGSYTSTLRVIGFAQGVYLLDLLSFLPVIGPVVRFLVSLLAFFAVWIGAATAHNLKGWRTLILPIFYVMVILLGIVVMYSVIGGFTLSIESLGIDFGLIPPP
jgi:uncharacterized membrane protein YvlD (DUF360 family)